MKLLAPLRLSGLLVLLALLCAAPLRSQSSPEEIREELRQVLRSAGYASLLASLLASFVQLGVREDLGSASSLRIDDEFSTKYELFRLGGGFDPTRFDNGDRLILEGDIGHITSSFATSDLFQGSAPGIATGIDQKLTSFSARVGLGYRHELGAGFYVRPMVDLFGGVLENEARYSGPGAATVGPLFDGLFFNWDSKFVGANGSLGLGFERSWDERYPFFARSTLGHTWLQTFDATDSAQEFEATAKSLITSVEQRGPTGLRPLGQELGWCVFVHNAWFPGSTGDDLGFSWFNEYGAALELDIEDWGLPIGELSFSGSYFRGTNVDGFSVGFGLALSL
jgi:hypothetical protein